MTTKLHNDFHATADHILTSLAHPIARIGTDGRVEFFELAEVDTRARLTMLYHETGARLIETAQGSSDLLLWVDEEGKLRNRPRNRVATMLHLYGDVDPIVGDTVVSGRADRETTPLTKKQIVHLLAGTLASAVTVRGDDR